MAGNEKLIRDHLNNSYIAHDELIHGQRPDHHEKLRKRCLELFEILGYGKEHITKVEEVPVQKIDSNEDSLQATVIRKESGNSPYIVALTYIGSGDEIKVKPDGIKMRSELSQLRPLFGIDCEYFVVFANEFLIIGEGSERYYNYLLDDLDDEDVPEIIQLLGAPEALQ